jgi:Fic family protein
MEKVIDELFLEVTGQEKIPQSQLEAKKQIIKRKSSQHKNILAEIINNPDIYNQFVLKLTYHTNRIEGSTLTEPDTAAILFDNVSIPNKSIIEQLEAKNHQAALNYLLDYILKKEKMDEKLILKLHSILMNGIRTDAGSFRSHAVRIVGVNLPTANYLKVPELISEIVPLIEKTTGDIVALSSKVHSQFEQIHPFSDGNGRIGRLLLTAMLLNNNLAPAVILQEQKKLYYAYLYKAQTKDDQSQLEDFICDGIIEGFKILERE